MGDVEAGPVVDEPVVTPELAKPVASDDYTGLTLEAHRNEPQGVWQFGVNLSGALIVLFERKLGGVDDDIREAIQPGFKAARAAQ